MNSGLQVQLGSTSVQFPLSAPGATNVFRVPISVDAAVQISLQISGPQASLFSARLLQINTQWIYSDPPDPSELSHPAGKPLPKPKPEPELEETTLDLGTTATIKPNVGLPAPKSPKFNPDNVGISYVIAITASPSPQAGEMRAELAVNWSSGSISVPLNGGAGQLSASILGSQPLEVVPGSQADLPIKLHNSAPGVVNALVEAIELPDFLHADPVTVPVPPNGDATAHIVLSAHQFSTPGKNLAATLHVTQVNISGSNLLTLHPLLNIKPSPVTVSTSEAQPVVIGRGSSARIRLRVAQPGASTTIAFGQAAGPQQVGVSFMPNPGKLGPESGGFTFVDMEISVGEGTPIDPNKPVAISAPWSANNGLSPGVFQIGIKVVPPLVMQAQEQSNWCYAATASSIAAFYNAAHKAAQCALVTAQKYSPFLSGNCCDPSRACGNECNGSGGNVGAALAMQGCLANTVDDILDFAAVASEIDAGRPIAISIKWSGGGGHAIAIAGYAIDGATKYLILANPEEAGPGTVLVNGTPVFHTSSGFEYVEYDTFRTPSGYGGDGTWHRSYLTQNG